MKVKELGKVKTDMHDVNDEGKSVLSTLPLLTSKSMNVRTMEMVKTMMKVKVTVKVKPDTHNAQQ